MAKVMLEKEKTLVTNENGEVLGERTRHVTRTVSFEQEPDYVKLYIQTISVFTQIKESAGKVFYELVKLMAYADYEQLVFLNPVLRKRIQDNLRISQSTFDKSLKQLRENDLIKRVANNTYAINPKYVGKGQWGDIRKLQASFDFITGDLITDFGYADEEE